MHDVAVIGAGAAGLFAALGASGALRADGSFEPVTAAPRVLLLDGQPQPGKKILISGGGRCNVTNATVTENDFATGSPKVVRAILREFPAAAVRTFFERRGLRLREEPQGKLFPAKGRARDVLRVLHEALAEAGVETRYGTPVDAVQRSDDADDAWRIDETSLARRVIIATGGLSVPETGSRGFGYDVAARLGHSLVATMPALAPLLCETSGDLAGITVPAIVSVVDGQGRVMQRAGGSLLFTHRGVSGPAALDASIGVERALDRETRFRVLADLWTLAAADSPLGPHFGSTRAPGACLRECPSPTRPEDVERQLRAASGGRTIGAVLVKRLPRRLVAAILAGPDVPLGQLTRERRREIARGVAALDLCVTGTEGYRKAEVTAGGVPLTELHRRTLESRLAAGLHFCGEVCDVTGRLGGFNFQWAWSSGFLAGRAAVGASSGRPKSR